MTHVLLPFATVSYCWFIDLIRILDKMNLDKMNEWMDEWVSENLCCRSCRWVGEQWWLVCGQWSELGAASPVPRYDSDTASGPSSGTWSQTTATHCDLPAQVPSAWTQYQLNDLEQWWLSASLFSPLDMSGTGTGASKTRAAPDARNILASTGHTGWRCGWPNVNQCWVTLLLLHICYLGQFLFSESGSRSTKHYTGTLPVTVAGNKSN